MDPDQLASNEPTDGFIKTEKVMLTACLLG